jgi:hypothetical protein
MSPKVVHAMPFRHSDEFAPRPGVRDDLESRGSLRRGRQIYVELQRIHLIEMERKRLFGRLEIISYDNVPVQRIGRAEKLVRDLAA